MRVGSSGAMTRGRRGSVRRPRWMIVLSSPHHKTSRPGSNSIVVSPETGRRTRRNHGRWRWWPELGLHPSLLSPHDRSTRWRGGGKLPDERGVTRRCSRCKGDRPSIRRSRSSRLGAAGRPRFLGIRERRPPMSRSRRWVFAGLLAVGASGCAQCDTCNQPPVPCTGPGCSAALNVEPFPSGASPMPATSTSPGAFTTAGPSGEAARFTAPGAPRRSGRRRVPPKRPGSPRQAVTRQGRGFRPGIRAFRAEYRLRPRVAKFSEIPRIAPNPTVALGSIQEDCEVVMGDRRFEIRG